MWLYWPPDGQPFNGFDPNSYTNRHLRWENCVSNFIYLAIEVFELLSSHERGQTDRHTSLMWSLPKIWQNLKNYILRSHAKFQPGSCNGFWVIVFADKHTDRHNSKIVFFGLSKV